MTEEKIINFINNKFGNCGDDTFCFKASGKLCVTKDILIENTHFKTAWSTPEEIGYKAVSVNISDLASSAAKPLYIFIGLGLPKKTNLNYVKKLYNGIQKACKEYGCSVAGGDTVRSGKIVISVTAVGECLGKPITRHGAKVGDLVFVTGTLGDSAAGLEILFKKNKGYNSLVCRHKTPKARLKESALIAECKPTAMMDVSDGLFQSLKILSKENSLGFNIDISRLPLSQQLLKYCKIKGINPYKLAIAGGEDFELLFTISKANAGKLKVKAVCIGEVVKDKQIRYLRDGKETKIKYAGFNHF
jgi:thiamine-monophosphate kinase